MSARHRKCPTPDKITYRTVAAAWAAATRQTDRVLHPYRCRGHWHLTRYTIRRRR